MNKEEAVSYIRNRIYRYIDVDNECTDEYIRERISREMHLFSKDNIISVNDKDYISKRVFDSIRGLDVLEGFLRDDCITEIMVNGTDNIFIEKFTPHAFRHTFATRCIEGGMKPKTLQKILGHSNIGITMNLYVHITEDEKHREIDLVADALKVV